MRNVNIKTTGNEKYLPLLMVLWKALLDVSYIYFVIPLFGYSGFRLNISVFKILESYLVMLLLGAISPKKIERISEFLIHLLFITVIIPILSYYSLSNATAWQLYTMVAQYVIVLLAYKYGSNKYLKLKPIKSGTKIAIWISLSFVITILCYTLIIQKGYTRLNFDLKKIYEVRETSNDLYASGIFGYLLPWTFRVFNILLIVITAQRKKYLYTVAFVFVQIILFGLTAFKAVLLYPLVLLGAYIVLKARRKILLFFIALSVIVGISLIHYFISGNIILGSIFIRRTFFIPAMINFQYYDFFEKHSFVYMSNSIFSFLTPYPYNLPPALLIGSLGGNDDSNANTGFLATAYMHFGFIGAIIFPLIVGKLLKFVDIFESRVEKWCLLGMLILPFNALFRSADLFTTLLTHGLGLAIFMIWLISDMGVKQKLKAK